MKLNALWLVFLALLLIWLLIMPDAQLDLGVPD
jgi:hypothetical protein